MKKTIILFIVLTLLISTFSFCGSAEEINFSVKIFDVSKSIVQIKGKLPGETKIENRLITVIAPDENINIADSDKFNSQTTLALDYAIADVDGNYSTSFVFNRPSGKYWFYVLCDEYAERQEFDFISLSDLAQFVKSINDGSCKKDEIISGIKERNNGFALDFNRFSTQFRLNLLEYRLYTNRNKLTGTTASEWLVSFGFLIDYAEREAAFLERLNNVGNYGEVYKILCDNVEFTGIDFSSYNMLDESEKISVEKTFLYIKFNNSEEVKKHFDEKVKEQINLPETDNGNSSGGGGGGGLGGGTTGGLPMNVTDTPAKDAVEIIGVKQGFADMTDYKWAEEAVNALAEYGIISGVGSNKFNPEGTVTREQIAKMIVSALNELDNDAIAEYTDVDPSGWAYKFIASAKKTGLMNGFSDTHFAPLSAVTREDLALILYRATVREGKKYEVKKSDFTDYEQISDYAVDAVEYMAGAKIINGFEDGSFNPKAHATRAQAAVLIYNALIGGDK